MDESTRLGVHRRKKCGRRHRAVGDRNHRGERVAAPRLDPRYAESRRRRQRRGIWCARRQQYRKRFRGHQGQHGRATLCQLARGAVMVRWHVMVLTALAPSAAWGADFSGTWKIDNLFNGATSVITCTLVQAGNALSGSCRPEIPGMAASDLLGTVDGSSAKWGYDVVFNGNAARVDYVVELGADDTLKGNLLRNGNPSPITAVKL